MKNYILPFALLTLLSACSGSKSENLTDSGLDPQNFIAEVDRKPTALYVLKNDNGMEAAITNYGGRIVSLTVPDRNGKPTDVVLGHDSIQDYINVDGNFGALIGRYGNRIANGKFSIDSTEYTLPQNNFGHCLHGGNKGFHHSVWDAEQLNDSTIKLTLQSPDGDAGFPGNLDVTVTYCLHGDNSISIDYDAVTDKPTIVNLTNHSYFNLSGNPENTILDETLYINASAFTPVDSTFMTTGEIATVENTPFDFRTQHRIGDFIEADNEQLHNGLGYDHNFVLDTAGNLNECAVRLHDNESGITLEVYTDQPGIQLYTGNFLDGTVTGKRGIAYPQRSALCLETQHYPDTPNKPEWPSVRLNPGEKYHTTTIYRFSAE